MEVNPISMTFFYANENMNYRCVQTFNIFTLGNEDVVSIKCKAID